MLDKNAILLKAKIPTGEADFLGDKVKVRGLTVGEQASIFSGGVGVKQIVPVCEAAIVGEDGKAMFKPGELEGLGLRLDDLEPVFRAIIMLTGMSEGTDKALEKN